MFPKTAYSNPNKKLSAGDKFQMEKWDILDSDGNKQGRIAVRGKTVLGNGEYHLVVHIWIFSSDGKILIQKRSNSKRLMPGEWAATGGAAVSGEDSFTAAARELKEELGIKSNKDNLKFLKRIKRRNSFIDIWTISSDTPIKELKLQKSEVSEVRWVSPDYLKTMIKEGSFHDYGKYYWSVIFGDSETEAVYEFKD